MSKIPVPEYAINSTGLTDDQITIAGLNIEVEYYRAIAERVSDELAQVTAEKIVAQRGRALELMSRSSAAVELENKLREQLALAEIRAEEAESALAVLREGRASLR